MDRASASLCRSALRLTPVLLVMAAAHGASPDLADAQWADRTRGVLVPDANLATTDSSLALEVNPAGLAFVDGFELAYLHVDGPDGTPIRGAGDAVYLATPLAFGLSSGLSLASVRPVDAAIVGGSSSFADRAVGVFGLGFAAGRSFGLGASYRYVGSQDGSVAGLSAWDLGASLRLGPSLAVSLLARDLTGPLAFGGSRGPATFVLATGLRPFAHRALSFDLAGAVNSDGVYGMRGGVEVLLPHVGSLAASAEIEDLEGQAAVLLAMGLRAEWGGIGAGGGALITDGAGASPGWYAGAQLRSFTRPGLPNSSYVLKIEIKQGLGARGLLALVQKLDRALHDPDVHGVYLTLESSSVGMAYAQEIRLMVTALRGASKAVVCHLADATGSEYYACAGANGILIDPAGMVRLMGPSSRVLMVGELAQRLGVRADFIRIGAYKSAPEQLTNRGSSGPALAQRDLMLDDAVERLGRDLAEDLGVTTARVTELIDEGPYLASGAVERHMVTAAVDPNDAVPEIASAIGGTFAQRSEPRRRAAETWGEARRIGVVVIDGDIVDGDNVDIPFVGIRMSGGRTVVSAIERFAADPRVKVIVVRVDTPGGSVMGSEQIWRALMRARQRKPVIASMGAVAASGGYLVAAAANEIWADPSTITGSIGVFFGKVDVSPLARQLGIGIETSSRGRHAGADSIYRPFTNDERLLLADIIREYYRTFLARVAEGRGMDVEAIDAVGRGRVWSGDRALTHGLIDRLGGFGGALARARELGELDPAAPVVIAPERPSGILDYVLGSGGSSQAGEGAAGTVAAGIPEDVRQMLAWAIVVARLGEGHPMARLEGVVELR